MAKMQTKLKSNAAGQAKRANPFQIVRDGEPLPSIATEKVRLQAKRSRSRTQTAHVPDMCPLCGGMIARFDAEIFLSFGRCAPCHEALTED